MYFPNQRHIFYLRTPLPPSTRPGSETNGHYFNSRYRSPDTATRQLALGRFGNLNREWTVGHTLESTINFPTSLRHVLGKAFL